MIQKNNKRLPFDWKNPIGYLAAVTFQYSSLTLVFNFVAFVILFGLYAFFFILSITSEIRSILKAISNDAKFKRNEREAMHKIRGYIHTHSIAKQWENELENQFSNKVHYNIQIVACPTSRFLKKYLKVLETVLMSFLPWCIITICSTMLMFQMELVISIRSIHSFIPFSVLLQIITYSILIILGACRHWFRCSIGDTFLCILFVRCNVTGLWDWPDCIRCIWR